MVRTLSISDIPPHKLDIAFLVAWGGMAAQAARLLGLLKLSLDLKKMGVRRWESLVFWALLTVALGECPSICPTPYPERSRYSRHVRVERHQCRNHQVRPSTS